MIHVQIASQVTAEGVSGVRWVLVEGSDTAVATAPQGGASVAHPAAAAAAPPPVGRPTASAVRLGALKLLAIGLGLGAALWTAHVQVGPPGAARQQAPAAAAPLPPGTPVTQGHGSAPGLSAPAAPAQSLPPAAMPDGASPPAPAASGGLPRLTAAL